jgi:hypothetical protein
MSYVPIKKKKSAMGKNREQRVGEKEERQEKQYRETTEKIRRKETEKRKKNKEQRKTCKRRNFVEILPPLQHLSLLLALDADKDGIKLVVKKQGSSL